MERLSRRRFLGSFGLAAGGALAYAPSALAAVPTPAGGGASVVRDHLQVNVRASAPARVRARAWLHGVPSSELVTPWQLTNASNAAQISLPGASLNKAWSWRGEVQDRLGLTVAKADVARRVPGWPAPMTASAFTFGFGSCIIHSRAAPAMTHLPVHDPRFFAIIGDMDYVDRNSNQGYALYSKWFCNWLTRPEVAPLVATCPILGVQDDHDYGLNDCWADTYKHFTARAFADVIPGAPYPAPTYRRWSIGDLDVWMLDCRRYKDPPASQGTWENGLWMSVLRSTQRNWLLNGLSASPARVKIVLSPMSFSCNWSAGEQRLVRQWINDHVHGTVIFCSGDRHATAFVHNPDAPRIWELLACPINNPVKHPVPSVKGLLWSENPGGRAISNAVGLVEVDTATAKPHVTLRAITDTGSTLHAITIRV